jgi:SulP family sulfate permease
MRATTLRSSTWRQDAGTRVLDKYSRCIIVLQLQGHLFFGNATGVSSRVEKILREAQETRDVWFLILDFTLVLAVDSSAAETLAGSVCETCRRFGVRVVYSKGIPRGGARAGSPQHTP